VQKYAATKLAIATHPQWHKVKIATHTWKSSLGKQTTKQLNNFFLPRAPFKYFITHRFIPLQAGILTGSLAAQALKKKLLEQQKKEQKAKEEQRRLDEYNQDIVTIFAHGLRSNANAARHRHVSSGREGAFIEGSLATFEFKDTKKGSLASFGQQDDVAKLEETCHAYAQKRKVLVGSSRGASTCLNYLGSKNACDVAAAVVESPFASMETLVSNRYKSLFGWMFPRYNPKGLQPITSAKTISKDVPIFIFCSKDDELIPVSQTIEFYKELRDSGHTKAHILIVDHGAHAKILVDKDAQTTRNTIHAFYKAYNIPHNAAWADAGEKTFGECQPSSDRLDSISAAAQQSTWKLLRRMSGASSGSR